MDDASLIVRVHNEGIQETTAGLQNLANQGRNTEASFSSLALKIAGYSSGMNLGIQVTRAAIREFIDLGKEAITLAGSFERSRVAWGVFLKDVGEGSKMFYELYSLAQRTPLSFQGVESAAQMLKGFGLATEEIIPTLERMGDVARGNDETMQRLALAYGQALAQGRVLTRDLYQFVNAGVPIFEALGQVMGKSVEQVQALVTEGKVGFPEIEQALKALTEEGGQFNGMMEKAAETFEGKLSIAKDNLRGLLAYWGDTFIPTLKKGLDEFNKKADETLGHYNVLKVTTGTGGNAEAAKAFLEAELAKMLPGTESPQRYQYEWALSVVNSILLEEARLKGSYLGSAAQGTVAKTGTGTGTTQPDWRQWLTEATGIDAVKARPELGGRQPTGSYVIQEWINKNIKYLPNLPPELQERLKKQFVNNANDLLYGMLTSGIWKLGEGTITLLQNAIKEYSPQESEKYLGSAESRVPPDRWMYMPGGGIPLLTPEQAQAELERITASVTLSVSQELSAAASRVPTDRWLYRPGGGTKLLTQEQADSIIATIDAQIATGLRAELAESANRAPPDRWARLPGGGLQYLTQEQADAFLNDISNRIAFDTAIELSKMAGRYKGDKWESKPGGGVPLLTPEQADSIIAGLDNKIFSSTMLELAEASKRAPPDRWLNKVGGGIPYLTPEEADIALETIQASIDLSTRIELEHSAARVSVDPYLYKPGGGVSFLSPEAAKAVTDSIDAQIATGLRAELAESAKRAPTDRWLNKVGGGIPYLTQEEAQTALDTIASSMYLDSLIEMQAMASRAPTDRWMYKSGGGKPYLTQEQADAFWEPINASIATELRTYLAEAAKRVPPDRWMYKPGGGIPLLTQEQADSIIATIDAQIATDLRAELSEAAKRVPPDRWMYKPGGGIPLLTQEQAAEEISRIDYKIAYQETQTPEGLFRLNMLAYQNAPPSTNWRERQTIAINPNTGDILGYTIQSAYTDAEKYRAALDELETRFANGEISTEGYKQALRELAEQYDTGTKLAKQFGDAILITTISSLTDEFYELGEAIADGANAWNSFGDAMSDTLETILVMLPKLAVQAGLQMLTDINPANDTLGLALIGGGLVGSVGAGLLKSNALGDVYTSPSLHQYANNVYDNPQLFTFAKGGVFAEAGPEAIMPLARDSTGKLGVSAKATGNIDIQINNYSSTPVASKTQTITDAAGNKKIILTLRDIVRQEIASANAGGVRKS